MKENRQPSHRMPDREDYNLFMELLLERTDCPKWQWCLQKDLKCDEDKQPGCRLFIGHYVRLELKLSEDHSDDHCVFLGYVPSGNPYESFLSSMVAYYNDGKKEYDDICRKLDDLDANDPQFRYIKAKKKLLKKWRTEERILFIEIYKTMKALYGHPYYWWIPEEGIEFPEV